MTIFHFVRHEESEGNVQARLAKETGALRLDIPWETPDIPLSEEGVRRAKKIVCPPVQVIYTSPYKRAQQTMFLALPGPNMYVADQRLRDKDHGVFDKLSTKGMQELYPHEWAARQKWGKFYHRPPNGESWGDVAVRIQEFMDSVSGRFESVLAFSHDVPILVAIMIAHGLSEEETIEYQKNSPVKNGSITTLEYEGNVYDSIRGTRLAEDRREPVGV